jgi:hypothetical protein
LLLVAASFLASCGGGGGGGSGGGSIGGSSPAGPTLVSVSPTSMTFSAASTSAPVPASQIGMATVSGLTSEALFVRIDIDGQVIAFATNLQIINQTQGQVTINPGLPANLGLGTHTTTITISACTTDPTCSGAQLAGSPKIINVTYVIGSSAHVVPDAVAPHIGTTNKPDTVILRGQGFTSATTVKFGTTAGTILSIPSDTEIRASYPALATGNHAVTLNNGAIPFSATLNIVAAPAYASTILSYPTFPQQIRGFTYDADRKTILVGAGFPTSSTNKIWRYTFSGGVWSTVPSAVTFVDLRDFVLSPNGNQLLAIADRSMSQLDPVTLASLSATPKPTSIVDPGEYLKQLAVANDGNVAVTTGYDLGSGSSILYFYSIAQSTFSMPTFMGGGSIIRLLNYATAGASSDGSTLAMVEANLSPDQSVARYAASNGTLSSTSQLLHYITPDSKQNINGPAFDRNGSRMAVANFTNNFIFPVYDANSNMLGLLPSNTAAFVISPDGTRAYTLEMNPNCRVRAFDLINTFGGNIPLTEIVNSAYPTASVLCPANGAPVTDIRMLVSPDGGTLFMAGNVQVVIVPLP